MISFGSVKQRGSLNLLTLHLVTHSFHNLDDGLKRLVFGSCCDANGGDLGEITDSHGSLSLSVGRHDVEKWEVLENTSSLGSRE